MIKVSNIKWAVLCIILLGAIIAHIPAISNPGFYNHDEWQKYDHIKEFGFRNFAAAYGKINPGPEFGYPMRPVSFLEQGFASIFMMDLPWVSHLIDLSIHLGSGLLFFFLLLRITNSWRFSLVALIAYVCSPLSIYSTAWLGASVDRVYTFWGLLAAISTYYFCYGKYKALALVGVCASLGAALLSKETALMLPAVLLVLACYLSFQQSGQFLRNRSLYVLAVFLGLPALAYLIYRIPALMVTLHGGGVSTYTPSISNLPVNALYYFSYPFMYNATDMVSISVLSQKPVWFGFFVHAALVGILIYCYGLLRGVLYIGFYFIFLLPVLMLPQPGAHYLYASTIPFSLLLAGLWCKTLPVSKPPGLAAKVLLVVVMLFVFVRFYQIEKFFYVEGVCQRNAVVTLNSRLETERLKGAEIKEILIVGDVGAKSYVAQKAFFAREAIGEYKGIKFIYSPAEVSVVPEKLLNIKMSTSCLMY
ncbi:hypothetical protein GCM10011613_23860 [Cellvibrio zantedeschiae]|uniref:Glycosyltransferase RgtA/B/C/D-like domain-containing protein n=1 Tax=Cellvibrio zantedeschiae TaxID=1237077 RepID=A0ABQ3B4Y5_9GAMM|nr:hypothetical protein [Cellvibrio zantedeschiae]GGY78434.1 hypothetical protein GCM10011613_23860 [Cellvibrio zantedeschiae]